MVQRLTGLTDAATNLGDVPPILTFGIWLEFRANTDSRRDRARAWVDAAARRHLLTEEVIADLRTAVGERALRQRPDDRLVIRLEEPYRPVTPARYALSVAVHRGEMGSTR